MFKELGKSMQKVDAGVKSHAAKKQVENTSKAKKVVSKQVANSTKAYKATSAQDAKDQADAVKLEREKKESDAAAALSGLGADYAAGMDKMETDMEQLTTGNYALKLPPNLHKVATPAPTNKTNTAFDTSTVSSVSTAGLDWTKGPLEDDKDFTIGSWIKIDEDGFPAKEFISMVKERDLFCNQSSPEHELSETHLHETSSNEEVYIQCRNANTRYKSFTLFQEHPRVDEQQNNIWDAHDSIPLIGVSWNYDRSPTLRETERRELVSRLDVANARLFPSMLVQTALHPKKSFYLTFKGEEDTFLIPGTWYYCGIRRESSATVDLREEAITFLNNRLSEIETTQQQEEYNVEENARAALYAALTTEQKSWFLEMETVFELHQLWMHHAHTDENIHDLAEVAKKLNAAVPNSSDSWVKAYHQSLVHEPLTVEDFSESGGLTKNALEDRLHQKTPESAAIISWLLSSEYDSFQLDSLSPPWMVEYKNTLTTLNSRIEEAVRLHADTTTNKTQEVWHVPTNETHTDYLELSSANTDRKDKMESDAEKMHQGLQWYKRSVLKRNVVDRICNPEVPNPSGLEVYIQKSQDPVNHENFVPLHPAYIVYLETINNNPETEVEQITIALQNAQQAEHVSFPAPRYTYFIGTPGNVKFLYPQYITSKVDALKIVAGDIPTSDACTLLAAENTYQSMLAPAQHKNTEVTIGNYESRVEEIYWNEKESKPIAGLFKGASASATVWSRALSESSIIKLAATPCPLTHEQGSQLEVWLDPSRTNIEGEFEEDLLDKENSIDIATKYGEDSLGTKLTFVDKEITPEDVAGNCVETMSEGNLADSLLDICGFNPGSQRVGEVANVKRISEAIVAIPYVSHPIRNRTVRHGDKHYFSINKDMFNLQKSNVEKQLPAYKEQHVTTISRMIENMKEYIIPPRMNFLEYDDISPFVMYLFEVTHELSQEDLVNIWQGQLPAIGRTPEMMDLEISHEFKAHEFFGTKGIPKEVRWQLFRVKRKAETNYFSVTADSTDDAKYKFKFDEAGEKQPDYSYNWPYDYCSLGELTSIEAELEVGDVKAENLTSEYVEVEREKLPHFVPLPVFRPFRWNFSWAKSLFNVKYKPKVDIFRTKQRAKPKIISKPNNYRGKIKDIFGRFWR